MFNDKFVIVCIVFSYYNSVEIDVMVNCCVNNIIVDK